MSTHDKSFAEALADLIVEYDDVPLVELIDALEEALILLKAKYEARLHQNQVTTSTPDAASNEHHEPLHGVWRD